MTHDRNYLRQLDHEALARLGLGRSDATELELALAEALDDLAELQRHHDRELDQANERTDDAQGIVRELEEELATLRASNDSLIEELNELHEIKDAA